MNQHINGSHNLQTRGIFDSIGNFFSDAANWVSGAASTATNWTGNAINNTVGVVAQSTWNSLIQTSKPSSSNHGKPIAQAIASLSGNIDYRGFTGINKSNQIFNSGFSANSTIFNKANLSGGKFGGVSLRNAQFKNANLANCSFIGVDLSGADLRNVDLRGTSFEGCNLTNASMFEADLNGAKIKSYQIPLSTTLINNMYKPGLAGVMGGMPEREYIYTKLDGLDLQFANLVNVEFGEVLNVTFPRTLKDYIDMDKNDYRKVHVAGAKYNGKTTIINNLHWASSMVMQYVN